MSDILPIFPLPNVVLFPNVFLPLHIFEPRYREMVADALEKQALLEQPCLRTRAAALVELLEMKIMMARTPGMSNVAH